MFLSILMKRFPLLMPKHMNCPISMLYVSICCFSPDSLVMETNHSGFAFLWVEFLSSGRRRRKQGQCIGHSGIGWCCSLDSSCSHHCNPEKEAHTVSSWTGGLSVTSKNSDYCTCHLPFSLSHQQSSDGIDVIVNFHNVMVNSH